MKRREFLKKLGVGSLAALGMPYVATAQARTVKLATYVSSGVTWPDVVVHLHGGGTAYLVDTKTDAVVATLDTCKGGTLGSTTPDAKKVYVSCAGEGQREVVVIDLNGKRVAKRIETGNRPKHGIVSPNGKWVGINHWGLDGGKLRHTFLSTADDSIVKIIDLEVAGQPKGVTSMHPSWSPDSKLLFSVDRVDNRLVVISTEDWSVKTFPVPSPPHYPVPSPDGKELWLVHEGNDSVKPGIIVYDLTKPDMPVIAQMDMPLIGEEVAEAHHGNFTQDGKLFMALNRGPGNDSRGREVAFFDAKTKQLVHRLTTASSGVGHAYNTPDGKLAVVTNYGNNVITFIDIAQLKTVKDLKIGTGRMGHIAFTKDGKWGYVSNEKDGNLYKIDMTKLEVVKSIETGNKPGGGQVLNVWTNVFEELPR
uniref:YncE family protein n=1 Tax=Thermus islandicus TaxID=540988 RepID=A0A7C2FVF5_9DEIN